jgi:hypothetical protein
MISAQDENDETNLDVRDPDSDEPENQNQGRSVSRDKYLENATTSYFINDFKINDIPETNPLQSVISEFVKRR